MKISMETKQKILIYLSIGVIVLIIAYLVYMGIKINKTSNKLSGTVKREFKDTNVNTLLEGDYAKVAKLNMYKKNKEVFVKDITQVEISNLEKIVSRGNKILSILDYQENADYSIILNDTSKANFYIRLNHNYIIITYLNENWVIYRANDVNYLILLLNVVDNTNISDIDITKYNDYKEINLEEYSSPFDLYLNSTNKLEIGTFNWTKKTSANMTTAVVSDRLPPAQILKNKNSVSVTRIDTFVSVNNKDTKLKLPQNTEIKYKFYKVDEEESLVQFVDAEKMIDSSYYIIPPEESSEYILYIHAEFDNTHESDYCIKCKI